MYYGENTMTFQIKDRINTPNGPGEITLYRRSSYSKTILFYVVKLDNFSQEYLCPVNEAKELND